MMTTPRRPSFLDGQDASREAQPATFRSPPEPFRQVHEERPRAPLAAESPPSPTPPAPQPKAESHRPATVTPAGPPPELIARYEASIEALRRETERLSERARADAIEIAFQVAQKLLEAELTNSEPLFALVRSAVQKLGETRRITIRVCPTDLAVMKSDRGQSEQAALRVAQIDLVGDPTLQRGDCIIESSAGAVDGRLSTRLAEVRRAVEGAAA